MWVCLNDAGMRVWGDVFPKGQVPVCSMVFQEVNLEDGRSERVIFVSWNSLDLEQRFAIVTKLCERSGAPRKAIWDEIEKVGLPLRECYTTGVVAAELRFFI